MPHGYHYSYHACDIVSQFCCFLRSASCNEWSRLLDPVPAIGWAPERKKSKMIEKWGSARWGPSSWSNTASNPIQSPFTSIMAEYDKMCYLFVGRLRILHHLSSLCYTYHIQNTDHTEYGKFAIFRSLSLYTEYRLLSRPHSASFRFNRETASCIITLFFILNLSVAFFINVNDGQLKII